MKYVEEYFCKHHAHKYAPQIFYFSILKEDNEDQLYIKVLDYLIFTREEIMFKNAFTLGKFYISLRFDLLFLFQIENSITSQVSLFVIILKKLRVKFKIMSNTMAGICKLSFLCSGVLFLLHYYLCLSFIVSYLRKLYKKIIAIHK